VGSHLLRDVDYQQTVVVNWHAISYDRVDRVFDPDAALPVRTTELACPLPVSLPLVHRAWLRFRKRYASYLTLCEQHAELLGWNYLREEGMTPEVARRARTVVPLPGLFTYNVEAKTRRGECAGVTIPAEDDVRGVPAATASAFLGWRAEKRVYRLTPELGADLAGARWPAGFPMEHFRLPAPTIALEIPALPGWDSERGSRTDWEAAARLGNPAHIPGPPYTLLVSTDLRTGRETTGALEFRIAVVPEDSQPPLLAPLVVLYGDEATVDDALLTAQRSARGQLIQNRGYAGGAPGCPPPETEALDRALDAAWSSTAPLARLAVNAILYILGDEDVVRHAAESRGGREAGVSVRRPRTPEEHRRLDLAPVARWSVGVRYAQAITRYLRDEATVPVGSTDGTAQARAVRPHLRAAHAHLYWTGPGRTTPRVRFLPPITVKGGPAPDADPGESTLRIVR